MRVLKFGGTSVGSAETIARVKEIVLSVGDEQVVVVVSAVGGITDRLISTYNPFWRPINKLYPNYLIPLA
jgi:aspartokinase/homoserine dehydrogenase 1